MILGGYCELSARAQNDVFDLFFAAFSWLLSVQSYSVATSRNRPPRSSCFSGPSG